MKPEELDSILQFAIDKEQEAIDFYSDLAISVKSEAIARELRGMAEMEMTHKRMLQSVDRETFSSKPVPDVPDLKIANYTVDAIPNPDMSWPDIVNIAMHRELAAMNLYTDLAAQVGDPAVKGLFENLAAEEREHKNYLETIWDEQIMKDN